jgi:uncharacterized protein YndB with AHSA1/START domain
MQNSTTRVKYRDKCKQNKKQKIMTTTIKQTTLTKDMANKKILVTREFGAPREKVWAAWTQPELLDLWWAPKPWKAVTKSMDFREGGRWHYYMAGPDGEQQWCLADYTSIDPQNSYKAKDAFCDAEGNKINDFPGMNWYVKFIDAGNTTKVEAEITFATVKDIETILEMGFQEGFTAAHGNLDELLAK